MKKAFNVLKNNVQTWKQIKSVVDKNYKAKMVSVCFSELEKLRHKQVKLRQVLVKLDSGKRQAWL